MYGQKRIVLGNKPQSLNWVSLTGNRSHFTIGVWYKVDGRFFADLRSDEQKYSRLTVGDAGIKGFGGFDTLKALRNALTAKYVA